MSIIQVSIYIVVGLVVRFNNAHSNSRIFNSEKISFKKNCENEREENPLENLSFIL